MESDNGQVTGVITKIREMDAGNTIIYVNKEAFWIDGKLSYEYDAGANVSIDYNKREFEGIESKWVLSMTKV